MRTVIINQGSAHGDDDDDDAGHRGQEQDMMVCGRVALGTIVKLLVISSKPAIRLSLKFRSLLKSNQKSWAFGLEAAKQTSKVPKPRAWEVLFVPNLSSGVSVGSPHSRMPSLKIPSLYGWKSLTRLRRLVSCVFIGLLMQGSQLWHFDCVAGLAGYA